MIINNIYFRLEEMPEQNNVFSTKHSVFAYYLLELNCRGIEWLRCLTVLLNRRKRTT